MHNFSFKIFCVKFLECGLFLGMVYCYQVSLIVYINSSGIKQSVYEILEYILDSSTDTDLNHTSAGTYLWI